MITVEQTIRSYSGKPGCMCGCLGTYNQGERARKLAITQLLKHPDVQLQTWKRARRLAITQLLKHPELQLQTWDGDENGCLFVRTKTRNRVLYLNRAGIASARALGVKEQA